MSDTLGKRLAALRKAHNLTQDSVAEQLGVSPQAVSKWENDSSCPDVMLLPKIAKLYNTSIDALLNNEAEPVVQVMPEEKRKNPDDMVLHLQVNDASGTKVRINLPLVLVKTALEIGLSLPQITGNKALENIDLDKIFLLIDRGAVGKLMEVETEYGTTVEIVVD